MDIVVFWDWLNIGIGFRIYKLASHANYHMGLDLQILWFDLWIQLFKKK
jgi:hypothetical protein